MSERIVRAEVIQYPMLADLLDRCNYSIGMYKAALHIIVGAVYGHDHGMLSARDRRIRLELYKLKSLLTRIELACEQDVFELGFRCPEQLNSYRAALSESMARVEKGTMARNELAVLDDLHERIWQVNNEVKAFYQGLS
jgi:hypothetical protein